MTRLAAAEILCTHCAQPIQGCTGAHGHWMHTRTRREHCPGGTLAYPETIEQIEARRRRPRGKRAG